MPTAIGPAIKVGTTGIITQAATTAFHAPVALDLATDLTPDGLPISVTAYPLRVSAIYIQVDTIAGGATSLTVRVSPDSTADQILIPDTSATIATGYTTATKGGVVYKVEVDSFLFSDTVYWTVKTNAGTCNVKSLSITYERAV